MTKSEIVQAGSAAQRPAAPALSISWLGVNGARRTISEAEIELITTAIHEAGHAVIGRILSMSCGQASIVPDFNDFSAGHSICDDPWIIYGHWDARGKYREIISVFRGRIMTFMAGAEAELEVLGRQAVGDRDDRTQIAMMAAEIDASDIAIERMRRHTRRLVRYHVEKIIRVADALAEAKTLDGETIDCLFLI